MSSDYKLSFIPGSLDEAPAFYVINIAKLQDLTWALELCKVEYISKRCNSKDAQTNYLALKDGLEKMVSRLDEMKLSDDKNRFLRKHLYGLCESLETRVDMELVQLSRRD